jgi:hypothetical protein
MINIRKITNNNSNLLIWEPDANQGLSYLQPGLLQLLKPFEAMPVWREISSDSEEEPMFGI